MLILEIKLKETIKDYVERFTDDDEMKSEYPDDNQRLTVAFDTYQTEKQIKSESEQIEHKIFDVEIIEIKQEGEKGIFKAMLAPSNNVDFGGDMVMPTFGVKSDNKLVPMLLGHERQTENGSLLLKNTPNGIMIERGECWLNMVPGTNTPMYLEAHKTYDMLLKGKQGGIPVKFSMGYKTYKYDYKEIDGIKVRRLIDGEVMEGSRVTFPMNPEAVQTNEVKSDNDIIKKEEEGSNNMSDIETKQTLMQMVQGMQNRDMMYMMHNALRRMLNTSMNSEAELTVDERVNLMKSTVMEFATEMPKIMEPVIRGMFVKEDANGIEVKEEDLEKLLEIKAGAKVSKATMGKLKGMSDKLHAVADEMKGMYEIAEKSDDDLESKSESDTIEEKDMDEYISSLDASMDSLKKNFSPEKGDEQ